jgi:hypothetical protein
MSPRKEEAVLAQVYQDMHFRFQTDSEQRCILWTPNESVRYKRFSPGSYRARRWLESVEENDARSRVAAAALA